MAKDTEEVNGKLMENVGYKGLIILIYKKKTTLKEKQAKATMYRRFIVEKKKAIQYTKKKNIYIYSFSLAIKKKVNSNELLFTL